jgi:hypothetical protein
MEKSIDIDKKGNNTTIMISIIIIVIVGCIYLLYKFKLKDNNCTRIQSYSPHISKSVQELFVNVLLKKVYVKTAYNCCCTGNFKNDYVDFCALINCNLQGVRALHFEIYSLNNKPIVSASINQIPKYKETYNQLDFLETMKKVNSIFVSNNITQAPLFIILDIYTKNTPIYESIYNTLKDTFSLDKLYVGPTKTTSELMNTSISTLANKVIVLINCINSDLIGNNLKSISYDLTTSTDNKIYSYTEFINITDGLQNKYSNNYLNTLNILVPYKQTKDKNYDFISSGVKYGISFIAMNFQFNDDQLMLYNDKLFKNGNLSNGSFTFKIYKTPNTTNYYSPLIIANEKSKELQQLTKYTNNTEISDTYSKLTNYL